MSAFAESFLESDIFRRSLSEYQLCESNAQLRLRSCEHRQVPLAAFRYNQTTMVPLRGVIDRFGADLAWDAENRTVTVTKGEDTVVLSVDVYKAQVNRKIHDLDIPPIINRNRTFIPLRFVTEGLGLEVTWNADEKSVTIKQ